MQLIRIRFIIIIFLITINVELEELFFRVLIKTIIQRVGFLRRFGQKTGIDFAYFGLESGTVFKETTGVYERIYYFNSK